MLDVLSKIYDFWENISDGYSIGVRNSFRLDNSHESLQYAVSQYVQGFYLIPFNKIRHTASKQNITIMLNVFSELPQFTADIQVNLFLY